MFDRLPRARIVYLTIMLALLVLLGLTTLNLQRQDDAGGAATAPDMATVALTEVQPETADLDQETPVEQNQPAEPSEQDLDAELAEQAAADATGLEFDHHGNPIRQDPAYEKVVANGSAVEFTLENFLGVGGRGGELAPEIFEGELAVLKFRISQTEDEQALTDLRPAVWLNLTDESEHADESDHGPEACKENVAGYLSGTLAARPDINMNSYFVLAMNDHDSISVIDPMIDVAGMTNLFSAIQLPGTGEDWAMSADQHHLFVTIPETGNVTVADLEQFWAIKRLDVGTNPVRIAFQPDQNYLWVGNDATEAAESGVTVIDPVAMEVVTFIPTGAGHHELAFSGDSRYAFVTNGDAGTLSVIDTQDLRKIDDLAVGTNPVAVGTTDQAIYVADKSEGTITVIDGAALETVGTLQARPGLADLRFTPDGRWGFVANPEADEINIFDAATNRLLYELPVQGQPDQISFSPSAAYIRTRSLPAVVLIPLVDLDGESTISVLTIPMGQGAPGDFVARANAVSATPEEGAMVIANPGDDKVYYYQEGAQAALGSFQGHGLRPRAVKIVDRSIHEVAPGVYQGSVRIPASGEYEVAFMLDSPQIVHCFHFTAEPNPELTQNLASSLPELEIVTPENELDVNEPFALRFTLTDGSGTEPLTDVTDAHALISQTTSNWKQLAPAASLGDGLYEITFSVPNPGLYNIFFAIPSLQANYNQLPNLYLQATPSETSD